MFNPTLPQPSTLADANQMRSQLNGLKALIDANTTLNNAQIDNVTTGAPGDPASVAVTVTSGVLHFDFDLPQGEQGPSGGPEGPQGPPGEVSNADLANAIEGTSSNSNAVAEISGSFGDPDAEELRVKLNELINTLRR